MLGILRLPPLLMLAIVLTLAAFVVYRIAAAGSAGPLQIIILILLAFVLVRTLFRMRRKPQEDESE